MSRFVLDCSVTMAWAFHDEEHDRIAQKALARLEHEAAIVPSIWTFEVANVIVVGERRGRIQPHESTRFLELISSLPIHIDNTERSRVFGAVVELARSMDLAAYDAAYLELAQRLKCPLCTIDQQLADAAGRASVDVIAIDSD